MCSTYKYIKQSLAVLFVGFWLLHISGLNIVAAQTRSAPVLQKIQGLRESSFLHTQATRDAINVKISQIKDPNKKYAAENITDQFDHVNQIWTDHFALVLSQLEAVLTKMEVQKNRILANGGNGAELDAAINSARVKITEARDKVNTQAATTYLIDPAKLPMQTTTTAGQNALVSQMRTQFKEKRDALLQDLFALRNGPMQEARDATKTAFETLNTLNAPN